MTEQTVNENSINKEQILKLFVENIEEINTKNDVGWTPLYRTIVADNCQATEILLEMGADPNVKSNMGETPLFQAVETGLVSACEKLLKFKADPNLALNDGRIPLHSAVSKKDLNLINLLLLHNSNPNAKNKLYSQTPLHLAMKNSVNLSIVDLLLGNGGDLNAKDKYDKTPMDYVQLEETKTYIINLLKEKNIVLENQKNDYNLNLILNDRRNNNNDFLNQEKNESIGKFLTPSKDEIFEKDFSQINTENKAKFETDISIIEKNNNSRLNNNNFNLEPTNNDKSNNDNNNNNKNNHKDNLYGFNINNLNTNFFSGIKNNFNFSEFLIDTDKNFKANLSADKMSKGNFEENNAFDLSAKNKQNASNTNEKLDNNEFNNNNNNFTNKDFSELNVNLKFKFEENKESPSDKYTIKIRDSNKFSLSDFQIKEIINNTNNTKNNNLIINQQQEDTNKAEEEHNNHQKLLNKNLRKSEKFKKEKNNLNTNTKNNITDFYNEFNNYATFENKNFDFDKIDLLSSNYPANNNEELNTRLSQNTQNTEILNQFNTNNTLYNYNNNNTNNNGEKPKTPKSVFSPMTFFKNNNTNSKSGSNSKYLFSEKDKNNANNDKEQNFFLDTNINCNSNNMFKLNPMNSLRQFNNNSNFNTLGSNSNSHNNNNINNNLPAQFSDKKINFNRDDNNNFGLLNNNNENESEMNQKENYNINSNNNNYDYNSDGIEENVYNYNNIIKQSNNNDVYFDDNKKNNNNNIVNHIKDVNYFASDNINKRTHSPSNYQSDSFEEEKYNKLSIKENPKELRGADFSCDEKFNNRKINNINNNNNNKNKISNNTVNNSLKTNSQLTMKNKQKDENSFMKTNNFKESNNGFEKEFSDNENYEENGESELISYINPESGNHKFYYDEKEMMNGNFVRTGGNYDSFISRDYSRNSFLFLTNRQSAENTNRSYCRSVNNNQLDGTEKSPNVYKSNNFEGKKIPQLSQHNLANFDLNNNSNHNKSKSLYRLPKESKSNPPTANNLPNIPRSRNSSLLGTENFKFKKIAKIKNNNLLPEERKHALNNHNDSNSFDFNERDKVVRKLLSPRDENNINKNNCNNNFYDDDFENNFNYNVNNNNFNNENENQNINKNKNNNNKNDNENNNKYENVDNKKILSKLNRISLSNKKFSEDINNNNNNENDYNANIPKEPKLFSASVISPSNIDINYKITENSYNYSLRDINNILNSNSAKDSNRQQQQINNCKNIIELNFPAGRSSHKIVFPESAKNNFDSKINNNNNYKDGNNNNNKIKINFNDGNNKHNFLSNNNICGADNNNNNENHENNFLSPENKKIKINYFNTEENISCLLPEEESSEGNENLRNKENINANNIKNNNNNNNNKNKNKNETSKNLNTEFNKSNINTILNPNNTNINNSDLIKKNSFSYDTRKLNISQNINNFKNTNNINNKNNNNNHQNATRRNLNTKSLILNNISPRNFSYGNLYNLSTNKNSNSNSRINGGNFSNKNLNLHFTKSQNLSNFGLDTLTNSYIMSNKARDKYYNFFSSENRDGFKNSLYADGNYVNNFFNTNSNNVYSRQFANMVNSTKSNNFNNDKNLRSKNFAAGKNSDNNYNQMHFEGHANNQGENYLSGDYYEEYENIGVNCISKSQALLLHNWLLSMNLAQYYNNFIENGLIDLHSIINKTLECGLKIGSEAIQNNFILKNISDPNIKINQNNNFNQNQNKKNLTNKKLEYEDLEKIGIKKPGHIFRILTRIQFDAKLINQNLAFFIINQINFNLNFADENNNNNFLDLTHSTSSLRVSDPKLVCCAFKPNKDKLHGSKIKNEICLQKFLENFRLKKYEKNFVFNGFDSLEFIYLQFFTSFKFDEEILETKLHIYEAADRKRIMLCLLKELKELNAKFGLNLSLNALYEDSLSCLLDEEQENLDLFDNRRVDAGCKACLIF